MTSQLVVLSRVHGMVLWEFGDFLKHNSYNVKGTNTRQSSCPEDGTKQFNIPPVFFSSF